MFIPLPLFLYFWFVLLMTTYIAFADDFLKLPLTSKVVWSVQFFFWPFTWPIYMVLAIRKHRKNLRFIRRANQELMAVLKALYEEAERRDNEEQASPEAES